MLNPPPVTLTDQPFTVFEALSFYILLFSLIHILYFSGKFAFSLWNTCNSWLNIWFICWSFTFCDTWEKGNCLAFRVRLEYGVLLFSCIPFLSLYPFHFFTRFPTSGLSIVNLFGFSLKYYFFVKILFPTPHMHVLWFVWSGLDHKDLSLERGRGRAGVLMLQSLCAASWFLCGGGRAVERGRRWDFLAYWTLFLVRARNILCLCFLRVAAAFSPCYFPLRGWNLNWVWFLVAKIASYFSSCHLWSQFWTGPFFLLKIQWLIGWWVLIMLLFISRL